MSTPQSAVVGNTGSSSLTGSMLPVLTEGSVSRSPSQSYENAAPGSGGGPARHLNDQEATKATATNAGVQRMLSSGRYCGRRTGVPCSRIEIASIDRPGTEVRMPNEASLQGGDREGSNPSPSRAESANEPPSRPMVVEPRGTGMSMSSLGSHATRRWSKPDSNSRSHPVNQHRTGTPRRFRISNWY